MTEDELQRAEISDAHRQELRRGSVVLASLLALRRPGYGYALLESLERAGLSVAGNTLYPLLRRLEAQGLLTSEWDTTETRPRKFYRTSREGQRLARALLKEWRQIGTALDRLDDPTDHQPHKQPHKQPDKPTEPTGRTKGSRP